MPFGELAPNHRQGGIRPGMRGSVGPSGEAGGSYDIQRTAKKERGHEEL